MKALQVVGLETTKIEVNEKALNVMITNDRLGKTISINNGIIQFTIPFEPLEPFLIKNNKKKRKKK